MKEYIEKDKPFSLLKNYLNKPNGQYNAQEVVYLVDDLISDIPAADVVEVVRCVNCKNWNPHYNKNYKGHFCDKVTWFVQETDYCAWGEHK